MLKTPSVCRSGSFSSAPISQKKKRQKKAPDPDADTKLTKYRMKKNGEGFLMVKI
jgi:hypothetical protein